VEARAEPSRRVPPDADEWLETDPRAGSLTAIGNPVISSQSGPPYVELEVLVNVTVKLKVPVARLSTMPISENEREAVMSSCAGTHVTTTELISLSPIVPLPFATVQLRPGGCALTVTL
jgi:hypothetical protein